MCRDRCIQRDRDQADEIASLRQALQDVESRYAEQLNRERQAALLQARAEADALKRSSIPVQPTSIYRDLPPPPPVQQSVGLGELASRLQAMQAAFRAQAYSVPQQSVEPPTTTAGGSVGRRRGARGGGPRGAPPPTLERAPTPNVSATAAVADAATAPAPALMMIKQSRRRSTTPSQLTDGPGFHRGYWQRAYGEALPTPGSLVA